MCLRIASKRITSISTTLAYFLKGIAVRKIHFIILTFSLAAVNSPNISAEVLRVPDDYETIQAAIEDTEDGDTVAVAPGEYNETINYHGRNIVVIGDPDNPAETIINGNRNGSVVTFEGGEGEDAVLTGFKIHGGTGNNHGNSAYGGGICVSNASPTISYCIINDNDANYGGGIDCVNSTAIFDHCVIYLNYADDIGGAIRCADSSNVTIMNCTISENTADNGGGSIFIEGGSLALVISSICWSNVPQEIYYSDEGEPNRVVVGFSDVDGGERNIALNDNGILNWGGGNIQANPLFNDPHNDDFSLTWDNFPEEDLTKSPCIDGGSLNAPEDPDRTRTDMGALYFDQGEPPSIVVEPTFFETVESIEFVANIANDGDRNLDWRASGASDWLNFEPNRGIIAPGSDIDLFLNISADDLDRGFYESVVRIRSNDPDNRQVDMTVNLYIDGGDPPEWISIPDYVEVFESDTIAFEVEGSDPDEHPLTIEYRSENLPRSARFTDHGDGTGSFIWHTRYYYVGEYAAYFTLSDGVHAVDSQVRIVVKDFISPFDLVSPADSSLTVEFPDIDFTWQAANDNPKDTIVTYSLTVEFEHDTLLYTGLTDTSHFVARSLLSIDPNESTDITWFVRAYDDRDSILCNRPFSLTVAPLSAPQSDVGSLPETAQINQIYPNPFNSTTTISFTLPYASRASLMINDIKGRRIATLLDEYPMQGYYHEAVLYSDNLPAGIYFVNLLFDGQTSSKKVLLLR